MEGDRGGQGQREECCRERRQPWGDVCRRREHEADGGGELEEADERCAPAWECGEPLDPRLRLLVGEPVGVPRKRERRREDDLEDPEAEVHDYGVAFFGAKA